MNKYNIGDEVRVCYYPTNIPFSGTVCGCFPFSDDGSTFLYQILRDDKKTIVSPIAECHILPKIEEPKE